MSDLIPLDDSGLLADTHGALVERWHVRQDAGTDWNVLLEALAERILGLLRDNPDRLFSALYVLDISERITREALTAATLQEKSVALAVAILERETQKIATRRKYASAPREIEGAGD